MPKRITHPQPAKDILKAQKRPVTRTAVDISVEYVTLRNSLVGVCRPTPEIIDGLVRLTGLPAEVLFDSWALAPRRTFGPQS
jgi:hypothetical protein